MNRFWDKVEKTATCWIWLGGKGKGYGRIHVDGKWLQAHRVSFVLHGGIIPEGLQLDHLCRNRACVNPSHLEPVTQRENILRGVGITAIEAKQTHCKRGHKFTKENTYITPKSERRCRQCKKATNNYVGVKNANTTT